MIDLRFSFDPSPLFERFDSLKSAFESNSGPQLQGGMRGAASRYMLFIRQRFAIASAGGGPWPDLAPSTKRRRFAKGRLGRLLGLQTAAVKNSGLKVAGSLVGIPILRDTERLWDSLTEGAAGNVFREANGGIEAGTSVPYAIFHQRGGGRLPQREIIVQPDTETAQDMASAFFGGAAVLMSEAIGGGPSGN